MDAPRKTCPKCDHPRWPDATVCPNCGVVYAKAMVPAKPGGPKVPAAWINPGEEAAGPPKTAEPTSRNTPSSALPRNAAGKNLVSCDACSNPISPQAQSCPQCGHPNPDAPRTAGLIAGVIALSLGIDASLMPYFAAVFLVPATYAAAAVTFILRMRTLAGIAAILASVGLWGIYQTSKAIHEAGKEAQKQFQQSKQEMDLQQQRLDAEMQQWRQKYRGE